jgi:hypothetical protein
MAHAINVLVKEYGDEAPVFAARRCDALLANGDMDGERIWISTLRAVEEIRRTERKDGERVN